MGKCFLAVFFIFFTVMGCSKVYVVYVAPQNESVLRNFSNHLETFLRAEGFIHWSESPDKVSREFTKKQIESDKTLKDLWTGPGLDDPADANECIVVFVSENTDVGILDVRFVFQRSGSGKEYKVQEHAGVLAAKLKNYLDLNMPNSQINVRAERVFDLR